MGDTTAIEWTDATYNPWRGCTKVSPGCAACYMFRDQRRYGRDPEVVVRCSPSTFHAPLRSRKWRELRPGSLVFTCSWSDWFHPDADGWRTEAWDVIRQRPDLRWQILTKRPELIGDRLPGDWGDGWPHVWLGVSIENRRFVHRADQLREVPAAVRFISAEPLLGPLVRPPNDSRWFGNWPREWGGLDLTGIDWLIAGGESGGREGRRLVIPSAEAFARGHDRLPAGLWVPTAEALAWVRDLRDACQAAGVAFFLKQWGGPRPESGGRELDGREWSEFPQERVLA